ncbi:MAG: hypothetical protein RI922_2391 [Bacteroidota bacterium]|jgi:hypothetical protein
MKFLYSLVLIGSVAFSLNSCKKYEGEGGKSSITGKIMIDQNLYINGVLSQTVSFDGAKEDVYLVYGDDDLIYDDKIEANYDGTFTFKYLQPGTYTIFAYNEIFHTGANATNNDDDYYTLEPVSQTFEVKKKEDVDLGTITLIK